MLKPIWIVTGLLLAGGIGVALATKAFSQQNSLVSETRTVHGHGLKFTQMQQTQPPLLSYVPTYYRDVQPILDKNCVACHVSGGIAPFALDNPKDAAQYARDSQFAVQQKRMPPWMPGGESPKFKNETKLSDNDIAVIANWAWAGAPLGKTADAKPRVLPNSRIENADVVMDIGKEFTPNPNYSDEYRCFIADPKQETERFITGYDIVAGNKKLVHHVIIFTVEAHLVPELRKLEQAADGRGGYECFGGPGTPIRLGGGSGGLGFSIMGNWVPGSSGGVKYPEGMGIRLRPGAVLVLQVHYNLLGGTGSDRTVAKLNFAPKGAKITALSSSLFLSPVEIACPSGVSSDPKNSCSREAAYKSVEAYQEPELTNALKSGLLLTYCQNKVKHENGITTTSCDFNVSSDRDILSVQGHMHLLGKAIKLEINPSTKRRVILDIPRWDFHWQTGYWLETPMSVKKGDVVRLTCTWDNSAENQPYLGGKQLEPRYVVWGEGTRDEMCLAGFTALPR
ncbi:MAG: hypothetical protein ACK41E_04185 [Deinococcales bacterium]